MTAFWRDVAYGARALARARGFTLATGAVLALGIGVATAMFSGVRGVLLRPLPYREPERLVALGEANQHQDVRGGPASAANFVDWRMLSRSLEAVAAYRPWGFVITGGDAERLRGARVSASLFGLLGVQALRGRTFLPEDDQPGQRVVLIGEGLWRRRFGGDPRAIGASLDLDGSRYTIVGVIPAGFALPEAELWIPLSFAPYELTQRGDRAYAVVARLRPGVSIETARQDFRAIGRGLAARYPDADAGWIPTIRPLREAVVGDARASLLLLFGATLLVLLAAATNVANLLLARAIARRREIAVRAALGASRARIVWQLAAESALLVLLGGAGGVLLANLGVRLLRSVPAHYLPRATDIHLDGLVLGFALLASLATALPLAGLPALQASGLSAASVLRGGSGGEGRMRRLRARDALVVAEVALALLLTVGAGLLVRSFLHVAAVPLGFSGDDVLSMSISLPAARYPQDADRSAFFREFVQRIAAVPGVRSAGLVSRLPLAGSGLRGDVAMAGRPVASSGEVPRVAIVAVTPDYFATMKLPVVKGRPFDGRDRESAAPVAIVDQTFARRFWPAGDALGRRVRVGATLGADTTWREIVGIVPGVHLESIVEAPEPTIYLPYDQNPWPTMTLLVRTATDPTAYVGIVRSRLRALDPEQAVYDVRPVRRVVGDALAVRRFQMLLLGGFAICAVLLALVGLYGVLAHIVAQRAREIGIRTALGATRRDIALLVLARTLSRAGAGILIGGAAALAATRVLRSALFEVSPWDPVTLVGAVAFVALIALAATALPVLRATRIDPVFAIRQE